jgi:hypothetical protein
VIDHASEEHAKELAEGVRIAYVAATRARDLLVVPAIGDDTTGAGPAIADSWWVAPLNSGLYPREERGHRSARAPMCPEFGIDSVLVRPDNEPANQTTVLPGLIDLVRRRIPLTSYGGIRSRSSWARSSHSASGSASFLRREVTSSSKSASQNMHIGKQYGNGS